MPGKPQLISKDQRTGKGTKKYGQLVYKCPTCSLSFPHKKIELPVLYQLINKMLVDGFYGSHKTIFEEMIKRNHAAVDEIKKDISTLETLNEQHYITIAKINSKAVHLMTKGLTDDNKKLLHLLHSYKYHIEQKINMNLELIQERQYQIDFYELVLSNFELWDELFNQLFNQRAETEAISFQERRLVLLLIDRIDLWETFDANGKNELKYDLFAKINLETKHYLEIDLDPDPAMYAGWEV